MHKRQTNRQRHRIYPQPLYVLTACIRRKHACTQLSPLRICFTACIHFTAVSNCLHCPAPFFFKLPVRCTKSPYQLFILADVCIILTPPAGTRCPSIKEMLPTMIRPTASLASQRTVCVLMHKIKEPRAVASFCQR